MMQLVNINGGNRYSDPIYVNKAKMTMEDVEILAGGAKLTYVQNPYM